MKTQKNILKPTGKILILATLIFSLLSVSCSNDDDNGGNDGNNQGYPREVTITYKVTSSSTQVADIYYLNEEGGQTQLGNEPLPFTKTMTVTVNQFDGFLVSGSIIGPDNTNLDMRAEVLVDGGSKDISNCSSNEGYISCSATYVFGSED